MSLTTRLADRQDLVRQFLEAQFPLLEETRRDAIFSSVVQDVLGLPLKAPSRTPFRAPVSASEQRSTVGTALDYRIRYYFALTPCTKLVAYQGAELLWRACLQGGTQGRGAATIVLEFFEHLKALLEQLAPVGKKLSTAAEAELCRYCYLLALYEALYRAGPGIESPLYTLSNDANFSELLQLVPSVAVQDLTSLASDFCDDAGLIYQIPSLVNPTFDGSADIGGADADFVIGATLFELKTVVDVGLSDTREWLYQLLGYTLLDYSDHYHIRDIGIWLARQRQVWTTPVGPLLFPPSDLLLRQTHSELEITQKLCEMRDDFHDLLTNPEHWSWHGAISQRMLEHRLAERVAAKCGVDRATVFAEAERVARQRGALDVFVDSLAADIIREEFSESGLPRA